MCDLISLVGSVVVACQLCGSHELRLMVIDNHCCVLAPFVQLITLYNYCILLMYLVQLIILLMYFIEPFVACTEIPFISSL